MEDCQLFQSPAMLSSYSPTWIRLRRTISPDSSTTDCPPTRFPRILACARRRRESADTGCSHKNDAALLWEISNSRPGGGMTTQPYRKNTIDPSTEPPKREECPRSEEKPQALKSVKSTLPAMAVLAMREQ